MKKIVLFLILSLISINGINLISAEYHVLKSDKNLIKFISKAPIEDFEGKTSKIDGYLKSENPDFSNGELYFEVDLRKLDTDNGLRDRHMRDNYLHTDKHPYASYTGKITKSTKKDDNTYDVESSGKFKVHGIEKDLNIKATVTMGDKPSVKSKFSVSLKDHNIEVPSLMFQKISEMIKLEVDFMLKFVK